MKKLTMLQIGSDSPHNGRLSLCSTCRSELRSIYSLGVPSYFDESTSNISNLFQNYSQNIMIMNDEQGMMQSAFTFKICCQDKPSAWSLSENLPRNMLRNVSSNSQTKSSKLLSKENDIFSNITASQVRGETNKRDDPTNVTLPKAQNLNNDVYQRVYGFVNLKDHSQTVGDFRNMCQKELDLSSIFESRHICTSNIRDVKLPQQVEPVINVQNVEKWRGIYNFALSKSNVKVGALKMFVDPEATEEIDLRSRRRNLYELTVRVSKLRSVDKKKLR